MPLGTLDSSSPTYTLFNFSNKIKRWELTRMKGMEPSNCVICHVNTLPNCHISPSHVWWLSMYPYHQTTGELQTPWSITPTCVHVNLRRRKLFSHISTTSYSTMILTQGELIWCTQRTCCIAWRHLFVTTGDGCWDTQARGQECCSTPHSAQGSPMGQRTMQPKCHQPEAALQHPKHIPSAQ